MALGQLAAWTGVAAAAAGCLLALLRASGTPAGDATRRRADTILVASAASLLAFTLALATLVAKFLAADLTTFYVWANASPENPWYYRLAGLWASQAGTLLLWGWYVALAATLLHLRARRTGSAGPAHHAAVALALLAAAVLAVLALKQHLFALTSDFRVTTITGGAIRLTEWIYAPSLPGPQPLDVRPNGNGLNPLLLSPFMAIHPWIEFAAYGATTLLGALAAGVLLTRTRRLDAPLATWARISWTLYTVAITLGAMWAYYTLSFGGYWAWDPVETANLVPWIVLSALLHATALRGRARNDRPGWAAPLLASAALAFTLFATFATRTGLWASSVHAFINAASADLQDPVGRLVGILLAEGPMRDIYRLTATAFLLPALLAARSASKEAWTEPARWTLRLHAAASAVLLAWALVDPVHQAGTLGSLARLAGAGDAARGATYLAAAYALVPLAAWTLGGTRPGPDTPTRWGMPRETTLLLLSTALLTLWFTVTALLLAWGVNGTQRGVYDARLPFVAGALALAALAAFSQRALGPKRSLIALSAAAATGVLAAAVRPGGLESRVAAFDVVVLGSLVIAAIGAALKSARGARGRLRRGAWLATGLVGLGLSTSPPAVVEVGSILIPVDAPVIAAGIAASLLAIAVAFRPSKASWSLWRPELRNALAPLAHVGVALLFLGYGASTYLKTEAKFTQDDPIEIGTPVDVGRGYSLVFLGSDGELDDEAAGSGVAKYASVTAYIEVFRGSKSLGITELPMSFVPARDHYDPSSAVVRQPDGDLYINADFANAHAMYTEADGWVVGHGPTTTVTSDDVRSMAMTIRVLPYVNLVWTGLWLLAAVGTAGALLRREGKRRAPPVLGAEAATEAEPS